MPIIVTIYAKLRTVSEAGTGRFISVNRETPAARRARFINAAAELRRSGHCGDFANARAFLRMARQEGARQ